MLFGAILIESFKVLKGISEDCVLSLSVINSETLVKHHFKKLGYYWS